jgi:electron transport complex protein RnfC
LLRKTFKGGVHPNDNKEHTKYLKIEDLPAPKKMVFPVSQHIGAPSEPVIAVGDTVKVGQLIAKQTGYDLPE